MKMLHNTMVLGVCLCVNLYAADVSAEVEKSVTEKTVVQAENTAMTKSVKSITNKKVSAPQSKKEEKIKVAKKSTSKKKQSPRIDTSKSAKVKIEKQSHASPKGKKAAGKKTAPKGDLIDEIKVIIYGDEGATQIITKSDLERPSIDGQPRTQESIILERLMYLDAQKFRMSQDDEAINKYLANIQREHNMTKEQLEELFTQSGYTFEEAREQLRLLHAVNSIVDFKIRSRLIVPEQDVLEYFESHPVKLEPAYSIQRAVVAVPADAADAETFKKELARWCAIGEDSLSQGSLSKGSFAPVWADAFWIDKSDLAANKQFITTMKVGSCAMGDEMSDGIELFKLVNKKDEREQPIEERYTEIADILRRPKYEELFKEYKKQLFDNASIVYL